jgi:drug/metabolite transporter (DMT)-like permease
MRLDRMGSRGVGHALAAALLFGAGAPAAKHFLDGTSPQLIAGLLYLGSGLGLLLFWLGRGGILGAPPSHGGPGPHPGRSRCPSCWPRCSWGWASGYT